MIRVEGGINVTSIEDDCLKFPSLYEAFRAAQDVCSRPGFSAQPLYDDDAPEDDEGLPTVWFVAVYLIDGVVNTPIGWLHSIDEK